MKSILMKKITIYLSEKQVRGMREISKEEGISVAELVRRAVDAFIKLNKK